ncbi:hypothetical protein RFI02_16845 [Acinetobacter sichuanensis]|uniref:hypothetical protein n=1 Tax=Acinetobacter sichuanensis TaxID=2136183 RepID=UPI00280FB769|nr:hypothetical protein [Acinetobacter sichuanensis]MDQ9022774.1 hypothetical protein [Acinetobacter sichuanensis]
MTVINNYESLIKKVGGIEKAKAIVDGAPRWASSYCKDSSEYYSVHDDFECCYNLSNLRTAIAQHEQGSNSSEFKVGDLVVDSTGFFDWLCKVDYLSSDGRVVMYKHDKSKNDTAYQTWPNIESVRHATPSEIKAGRRLDHSVDVTDMVTDIRNHISPNTKVVEL